ncbi:hypothetical protein ACI68E_003971 [Malassezia pachydermatis]|uniref:Uncharacterized protein n=1 Tax=Malassezia pachydermatis TaxID=77020 RepID=A0A0N0RRY0_9BASI|nr:hypothetical protein Malapachy_0578 [Malassezia pachydermatis]KOS12929.1 hypothetical protein Malapachy_0578 [Malassezia pachydermatis]
MDSMKESENGAGTTSTRVFTRHTLLQLSQSPLVHVPPGMAAMDEWYGPWRPYTPKPFTGVMNQRDGRPDHGDGSGGAYGRREFGRSRRGGLDEDTGRRVQGGKSLAATAAPAIMGASMRPRARQDHKTEAEESMVWRRSAGAAVGRTGDAGHVPAWMSDEPTTRRPAASGVEAIEAFKAQMREMERRKQGGSRGQEPDTDRLKRDMHQDLAQDEPDTERSSRFARFFDVKGESKTTDSGTASPSVSSLDLFGMLQSVQKRDPTAEKGPAPRVADTLLPSPPAATPLAASVSAAPPSAPRTATPTTPLTPASSRAPLPPANTTSSTSTLAGTTPAPSQPPSTAGPTGSSGMASTPASSGTPSMSMGSASSGHPGPIDGLPKPSAADMASMQMLMAKLMGSTRSPATTPSGTVPVRPPPGLAPSTSSLPGTPSATSATSPPPGLAPSGPSTPGGWVPPPPPPPQMTSLGFLQSLMASSGGTGGRPPASAPGYSGGPPPPPPGMFMQPPPGVPPPPHAHPHHPPPPSWPGTYAIDPRHASHALPPGVPPPPMPPAGAGAGAGTGARPSPPGLPDISTTSAAQSPAGPWHPPPPA